jgi:RNA polymerase sigma-70 factor (ECF subfamily)
MVPSRTSESQDRDIGLHLLVLRCQAGDERAFARLLDQFGDRTLRYLRGLVGDDAEDVQQDLWLAVYTNVKTLANPRAFRTWLFRTTRHRAIDFLRSTRRERELFDDVELEVVEVSGDQDTRPPEFDQLGAALEAIPPPQREALLLKYQDDLSYEEIAVVVGVPIGTVRTRIHHGKKKLAQLLTQQGAKS